MPLSADGQVITLACSALALEGDRSIKPLSPTEWHKLSLALQHSSWERPRGLLGRDAAVLRSELGIAADLAERLARLLARGGQLAFAVDRLATRGIWVLTRADDAYPPRLKKLLLGQAPPLLFGAGPQGTLAEPSLAVVGSRDAHENALAFARDVGLRCARQRIGVISGAARGVDLGAMLGAIDGGGTAIGVTVDPLERLVRRTDLRGPLTDETLTLVTPFHPSARWHAGNAMRRNRLVYVMSRAAVVVATATNSGGTWAGALENLKHSWVPLHVRDDGSPGSRELERAGGHRLPDGTIEELDVPALFEARVHSLIDEPAEVPAVREPEPALPVVEELAASNGHEPDAADDVFWVAWPLLEACLRIPRSEREVAETLKLELTQARAWLKRAVEERRAEVEKGRRKLYIARKSRPGQLRITDSE